jgi:2-polyprenyl-3-methyl-5-hydroxy-6-metoxy-1,4-benzoquinol methylase
MTWKDYWKDKSAGYIDALDGPYHRNRLKMVRTLLANVPLAGKDVVDFGCGEGVFARELLEQGASIVGLDIDATMVDEAKRALLPRWPQTRLIQGGVESLAGVTSGSADILISLNVLAYLSEPEERTFYAEAHRILRPDGGMLVTHSNELFDLFTCNRYTAAFFERNFSLKGKPVDVTSLLTHPDKPDRKVFGIRENPLAYRHKLTRFGFDERRQEFAILHRLPPLLTPQINFDDINSREYPETVGWPEQERWKLMFMCSIFGSYSVRERTDR